MPPPTTARSHSPMRGEVTQRADGLANGRCSAPPHRPPARRATGRCTDRGHGANSSARALRGPPGPRPPPRPPRRPGRRSPPCPSPARCARPRCPRPAPGSDGRRPGTRTACRWPRRRRAEVSSTSASALRWRARDSARESWPAYSSTPSSPELPIIRASVVSLPARPAGGARGREPGLPVEREAHAREQHARVAAAEPAQLPGVHQRDGQSLGLAGPAPAQGPDRGPSRSARAARPAQPGPEVLGDRPRGGDHRVGAAHDHPLEPRPARAGARR